MGISTTQFLKSEFLHTLVPKELLTNSFKTIPTQLSVSPGMYHGEQAFVSNAPISRRMIKTYISALDEVLFFNHK